MSAFGNCFKTILNEVFQSGTKVLVACQYLYSHRQVLMFMALVTFQALSVTAAITLSLLFHNSSVNDTLRSQGLQFFVDILSFKFLDSIDIRGCIEFIVDVFFVPSFV
ncbi:hypothetical protein PPL_05796 [Heterostelium album PN500]|uniref:Uncharacterized protein n=1 Tax=Heterostelium pallidum (strain ATCC 26659 / Pp 5 / PN500) TaxID=670386 RepID=D3BB64_HETP5|nr:hypothetical protein PPL_05796 [Heterostelium album PN500]EFA81801.1 hypothetical protein PPL_05796 [Heterostelium album PN500]|eukprot:XP_020433918.1 hypothetical protein PPL_05796 [Heterostelium album PN500]